MGAGLFGGFVDGEAGEVGDVDLAAVDGEAHGEVGGEECDEEERTAAEEDVEEAVDPGEVESHALSGYRQGGTGIRGIGRERSGVVECGRSTAMWMRGSGRFCGMILTTLREQPEFWLRLRSGS